MDISPQGPQHVTATLASLLQDPDVGGADPFSWLTHAPDDEIAGLLAGISATLDGGTPISEHRLAALFRGLVERAYLGGGRTWNRLTEASLAGAVRLYGQLGPRSGVRHLLLQLLAASRRPDDLQQFTELLVEDPPGDETAAAVALGPLFQHRDFDAAVLFPRLFDALSQPALGAAVLDLSNYVTREGLLAIHPATDRRGSLATLLGAVVQRLGVIEDRPETVASDPRELSAVVQHAVSLAVSLCDSLGLIGDPASVGKLNQVLELRHRRLRTEAAAALARLGDENGQQVLSSLAAEPVARLRVLAYASELGLESMIDERFATSAARAEAELACWLAQPTQLGFPPSRLELVDTQTYYWPGYDEPVECFLFRYAYEMSQGEYAGIGIAGPLCHAFAADLADLPPEDIFAVFAGWHAEHDEIYELDAQQLNTQQRVEVARLARRLQDQAYVRIEPVKLGLFFQERVLIALAERDGQAGVAVVDPDAILWIPTQGRRRPLGADEAYALFKGRRILRAFNP